MNRSEKLSEREGQLLTFLLTHHDQAKLAYPIAQNFIDMVKNRKAEEVNI
jgi:hypothetical protein